MGREAQPQDKSLRQVLNLVRVYCRRIYSKFDERYEGPFAGGSSTGEGMLREAFGERVLPFDRAAVREYADIAAMGRSAGRSVAPDDCQIAAIARSQGMTVATRNVRDFDGVGVDVVNPWTVK